jgi:Icc-related predicted phosphoesterase
MRFQIFSDLHVDVRLPRPITMVPDIDAVVVAGDTCEGAERGFAWLRRFVPMQAPIVMVMGNHEFYRRCLPHELAQARSVAPLYGVHLLENDVVTLNGVRFVGATMWTDYQLFGVDKLPLAMGAAAIGLNDHKRIKWSKEPWRRFRPQEAVLLHRQSRAFIDATLALPFTGATVVLSHHAPHPGSLHPRYANDYLSGAYVSDLTTIIEERRPDLWIHGHVHSSFDYRVGDTRVLCNPHGYGNENPRFDPALVVEVGQ